MPSFGHPLQLRWPSLLPPTGPAPKHAHLTPSTVGLCHDNIVGNSFRLLCYVSNQLTQIIIKICSIPFMDLIFWFMIHTCLFFFGYLGAEATNFSIREKFSSPSPNKALPHQETFAGRRNESIFSVGVIWCSVIQNPFNTLPQPFRDPVSGVYLP